MSNDNFKLNFISILFYYYDKEINKRSKYIIVNRNNVQINKNEKIIKYFKSNNRIDICIFYNFFII